MRRKRGHRRVVLFSSLRLFWDYFCENSSRVRTLDISRVSATRDTSVRGKKRATCLFVGRIYHQFATVFSFFVSARGRTRITLNVTRLSGAHMRPANYHRYIIVLRVRAYTLPSFSVRARRAAKSTSSQRGVIYASLGVICEIMLHLYIAAACNLLRSV